MEQWQRNKLEAAFNELSSWLLDHTEEAFEEEPEIDNARTLIGDVLDKIKEG